VCGSSLSEYRDSPLNDYLHPTNTLSKIDPSKVDHNDVREEIKFENQNSVPHTLNHKPYNQDPNINISTMKI
jgi:hypothetical protein